MNVQKRMSVFTAIALGITAIVVTAIVSASAIVVYGMAIVDAKTDGVINTIETLVEELPTLKAALPPALTDAMADERKPDYRELLDINVDFQRSDTRDHVGETTISVSNNGDEVVSMLAMRLVTLDDEGHPISAGTEYIATPLSIDNEWRGPLLPGSTRRAAYVRYCADRAADVEYEITELRVWTPPATDNDMVAAADQTE